MSTPTIATLSDLLERAASKGDGDGPPPADKIKKGTKLRLERVPIYASSGTGKGRQSTKTVDSVKKMSKGPHLLIQFRGTKFPGTNALDTFQGIVKDGYLVKIHGDRANYDVVGFG